MASHAATEGALERQRERMAIARLHSKGDREKAALLERSIAARTLVERGLDPALALSHVVWPTEKLRARQEEAA